MKRLKMSWVLKNALLLLLIITLTYSYKHKTLRENIDERVLIKIPVANIDNALWYDNNLILFQKENIIYSYNLSNQKQEKKKMLQEKSIFGIEEDKLLICRWENYVINSPKQIATKIDITDKDDRILKTIELHKTIKPLNCNLNEIDLIDNYHGSPERKYSYKIDKSKYIKYESKGIKESNIDLDIKHYHRNQNNNLLIIDTQSNLWLYTN